MNVSKGFLDGTSNYTLSTAKDPSLNDAALKKPEGDIGNPALGGATVCTNGEVANPYEGLKNDAKNDDRVYQELDNYKTVQIDS